MTKTVRERVKLFLKGMTMGAADVVPGVSGGTIAFISGIYEELLATIGAIGPETLRVLRTQGLRAMWLQINGAFLVTLLAGIATSILLLVRPITWAIALMVFGAALLVFLEQFAPRDDKPATN